MKQRNIQVIIAFLTLVLITMVFYPTQSVEVQAEIPRIGEMSRQTIIAPLTFDIPKSESVLEKEREKTRERVPAYLEYDIDKSRQILDRFDTLINHLALYSRLQVAISSRKNYPQDSVKRASEIYQDINRSISTTAIHQLAQNERARDSLRAAFYRMIERGISEVYLINSAKQVELYKKMYSMDQVKSIVYNKPEAVLIKDNTQMRVEISELPPREIAVEREFSQLQLLFPRSQALQSAFYEALYAMSQPNIYYLESYTEQQQAEAAAQINPSRGKVVKGMEIIRRGDIMTTEASERIAAMTKALSHEEENSATFMPELGMRISLLLLILFFAFFYLYFDPEDPRNEQRNRELWALITILSLQVVLFFFSSRIGMYFEEETMSFLPPETDLIWLHPFLFAPILTTLLLGLRIGIATSLFTATYLGMISSFDLSLTVGSFGISIVCIFFLKDIRYRSQFLVAALTALASFLVVFMLFSMLRNQVQTDYLLPNIYLASAVILVTSALSIMFIAHIFEKLFRLTTNLTLMELSDFNHPVLKEFSVKAPGSFHHSIMVSNLAEKAANRIEADTLLTRVMALYHDIGKGDEPQYYTENQKAENPHLELNPWDSVKRIRYHVTRGLEIGREAGLPPIILSGIPEHHGDNIIQYFYKEAKRLYPERALHPEDFRYEGPRPQCRETAILMLADGIEAASRSLDNPSSNDLIRLVQKVIRTRVYENQLSDCGINLGELQEIEFGFLQALEGMYHTRIKYPEGVFVATIEEEAEQENNP